VRTTASIEGRLRKAKEKIRLVFFSPSNEFSPAK
jgi:hypothetical protein